jgi:hypothetical protein
MIGLTNNQNQIVTDAERMLPVEKRDLYLQRIAAMLALALQMSAYDPKRTLVTLPTSVSWSIV